MGDTVADDTIERTWETLRVELRGGLLLLELANPPLNVLTQTMRRELGSLWLSLQADPRVRCVVWRSSERAFCAGADLKEFPLRFDPAVARAHGYNAHRMMLALVELDVPVIAALRGACMGGGLELALGCGYRIAAASARLALPEVRRGVWPGTGGAALLARQVGPSTAKRLLYTGVTLNAQDALALGLVDEVVADEILDEYALDLARSIAAQPAPSVHTLSQLVDRRFRLEFREHLAFELERFVQAYQLPDAREGNTAFFEKREPRWA